MLWTPGCDFMAQVDNFGSTYTEAGLGTQITAGGTNHTKNSTITTLLSALSADCYFLSIGFVNGFLAGASRRYLTDIFTDPAGGTSWGSTPIIANLAANSVSYTMGGCLWYRFPLFIKAGTSIGARCQAETASATIRVLIEARMKPTRPEVLRVGQMVSTFGATTATTVGTAITPGSAGAMGSYAQIGAPTKKYFYAQSAVLINDGSQTAVRYWVDLAKGDASNKYFITRGQMHVNVGTGEVAGFHANGTGDGEMEIRNGDLLYMRVACDGTPDSNFSGLVYLVG